MDAKIIIIFIMVISLASGQRMPIMSEHFDTPASTIVESMPDHHPSIIGTVPLTNSPMVILSQSLSSSGGARPPVGNNWNVFATAIESFNLRTLQAMEYERPNENLLFSPLSLSLTLSKLASGSMNVSRLQILETLGVRSSFASFRWMNRDIFRSQSSLLNRGISIENTLALPPGSKNFITSNFLSTLLTVYRSSVQTRDATISQYGNEPLSDPLKAETRILYESSLTQNLFSVSNRISSASGVQFDNNLVIEDSDQIIDGSNYFVINNANGSNGSFVNRGFGRSSMRASAGLTQAVIRGTFDVASMDNFVLVKIPYQEKLSLEIFIPKSTLRSSNNHHARNGSHMSDKLSSFSILSAIEQAKKNPMKLRIKMPRVMLSSSGTLKKIFLPSQKIGVKNIFDPTLSELSETSNAFGISVSDIEYKNSFSFPNWRPQSTDTSKLDAKLSDAASIPLNAEEDLKKEHRSDGRSMNGQRPSSYRVYSGGVRRDISITDANLGSSDLDGDKKEGDKYIPITIHAPFLFLIRDELTGHNLFLGKLINPFA